MRVKFESKYIKKNMSYHVFILPNLTQLSVIQYFFNKKNFLTNRNNSSVTILNSYNLYNVNFDDESRYPATPNPTPRDTRILQTNYILLATLFRDLPRMNWRLIFTTNLNSTPCCYFNYFNYKEWFEERNIRDDDTLANFV